jgi:hypothetical protein
MRQADQRGFEELTHAVDVGLVQGGVVPDERLPPLFLPRADHAIADRKEPDR